jgi:hypothetical protein
MMNKILSFAAIRWKHLGSVLLGLACSLLIWLPVISAEMGSTHDQALEIHGFREICTPSQIWSGWPHNKNSLASSLGSMAPNLPQYTIQKASCLLGDKIGLDRRKAYLTIGIALTVMSSYFSGVLVGLPPLVGVIAAVGIATAPCSFSRIAHLSLSQLWPIPPATIVCMMMLNARNDCSLPEAKIVRGGFVSGTALGLVSYTAQEYWGALSILSALLCFAIGSIWRAESSKQSISKTLNLFRLMSGYIFANIVFIATKKYLWAIPSSAVEATQRSAYEQFLYGFWPIQLFTSPLINGDLTRAFMEAQLPMTETPFGSSGGIVISLSLAITLIAVRQRWNSRNRIVSDTVGDSFLEDLREKMLLFGLVTLIATAFALTFATAGGLGTVLAVYMNPQLRALNRITPFIYVPAVYTASSWLYLSFMQPAGRRAR